MDEHRREAVLRIGIAMLQGARSEHAQALLQVDSKIEIVELRKPSDLLLGIDALILPGGESTSMRLASTSKGLLESLFDWMIENEDKPVLGTCAGAILLCQPEYELQPFVNAIISRNSFGRQSDSFQAKLKVQIFEDLEFPGVFIRAPRFIGNDCQAVAWLGDEVVGILDGNRMALTFHPELTDDLLFHRWLISQASS